MPEESESFHERFTFTESKINTVSKAYERVLQQLQTKTNHYVLITNYMAGPLHSFFNDERNLTRLPNVNSAKNFLEAFSYFANSQKAIGMFIHTLSSWLTESSQECQPSNDIVADNVALNQDVVMSIKEMVLAKCESMERQLFDGTIFVGTLTRKIIIDTIERVREAAENDRVGAAEEIRIDKLLNTYNFKKEDHLTGMQSLENPGTLQRHKTFAVKSSSADNTAKESARVKRTKRKTLPQDFRPNEQKDHSKFLGLGGKASSFQEEDEHETTAYPDMSKIPSSCELFLAKCEAMEQQLNDGSVVLGVLTKRIVLKAIEDGKLAANENMLGGSEELLVHEYFDKYEFHKF